MGVSLSLHTAAFMPSPLAWTLLIKEIGAAAMVRTTNGGPQLRPKAAITTEERAVVEASARKTMQPRSCNVRLACSTG